MGRGPYARAAEVRDGSRGDRTASLLQVEGEWSFGHTRLAGEWLWTRRELAHTTARVNGGWVEGTHTLTPRLFVAGRYDEQWTHWINQPDGREVEAPYRRAEATVGVRLTPHLTLRGSYLTRKGYVVGFWDDQVQASVVFSRRIR